MHRALLPLLLVATGPWPCAAAPAEGKPVTATLDDGALASLTVGDRELLADGTPRLAKVVLRQADAPTGLDEPDDGFSLDPAP
ncbi:MAG: hypothetical protein ACODAJ_16445 [Planctomycetota bacterium]